ncbi:CAP domain-containing protein [Candidatus Parcubacteria bacterium]|nr:CAP domain-containing protein [Candidatus Parcubacteria bacterium]
MKNNLVKLIILLLIFTPQALIASKATADLSGRILLQVEQNGEAWYVNPITFEMYFLSRPMDAFQIMREQGIGITNKDLNKIPIGLLKNTSRDSDNDGLGDALENSIGTDIHSNDSDADSFNDWAEVKSAYNAIGKGVMPIDLAFSAKQNGRIFLQVESRGEAWYVNPGDNKRYFLGRPADAFEVMRSLGLGISDQDLFPDNTRADEPVVEETSDYKEIVTQADNFDLRQIEFLIMELVNQERLNAGLEAVEWNSELANVAREHSRDLANENSGFTGFYKACDYPIIHHEGNDFGFYNSDRLNNRDIYYYQKTGENIALVSAARVTVRFKEGDPAKEELENCAFERSRWDEEFRIKMEMETSESAKLEDLNNELDRRGREFNNRSEVEAAEVVWLSGFSVARDTVRGWMESQGHKDNILTAEYNEAGVGVDYVNGYIISTQVFINRAVCGYPGGACCKQSGYMPYCYIPYSCEQNICVN